MKQATIFIVFFCTLHAAACTPLHGSGAHRVIESTFMRRRLVKRQEKDAQQEQSQKTTNANETKDATTSDAQTHDTPPAGKNETKVTPNRVDMMRAAATGGLTKRSQMPFMHRRTPEPYLGAVVGAAATGVPAAVSGITSLVKKKKRRNKRALTEPIDSDSIVLRKRSPELSKKEKFLVGAAAVTGLAVAVHHHREKKKEAKWLAKQKAKEAKNPPPAPAATAAAVPAATNATATAPVPAAPAAEGASGTAVAPATAPDAPKEAGQATGDAATAAAHAAIAPATSAATTTGASQLHKRSFMKQKMGRAGKFALGAAAIGGGALLLHKYNKSKSNANADPAAAAGQEDPSAAQGAQ